MDFVHIRLRGPALDEWKVAEMFQAGLFGFKMSQDLKRRLEKGEASDGGFIPAPRVNMYRERDRWAAKDRPAKNPRGKLQKPRKLPPQRSGIAKVSRTPASVFQVLRVRGGHFQRAEKGVHWKGWDEEVRIGWDGGGEAGKVWGCVWDNAENFVRSNYGPTPGIRTGVMADDITYRVDRRGGRRIVRVYIKGKDPRGETARSLLQDLKDRERKALDAGRKPRKVPSSYKAALLQVRDRQGRSGRGASGGVGFIDPPDDIRDRIFHEVFSASLAESLQGLPIRVEVIG